MASVDGSRSYLTGSDEVIQHTCGPCKDDGEIKEAKFLCEICKVYLCFDCRNDHNTFKATKNHQIVSANLTQGIDSTVTTGTYTILCGCDQKRVVEVYCEKHDEVICPSCETIKHRNCTTCPIKDKVNKHTAKQLTESFAKAKLLKAEIGSYKQDRVSNCNKLDNYKQECKKEITTFRREINKILDKMEEEILKILDKTANQKQQVIEKQIADIVALLQALDTDLDIVDNANKTNRDEIMFSANVKLSKSLAKYEKLIKDIMNGMQHPQLKFQQNKKLADMLKSGEGFGSIKPSETGSSQQDLDHVVILDMKMKSRKEVNIKLPNDDERPFITGCTFLSNGRILLCDNWNQRVKLLDNDMSIKKSRKLSETPWNVAAVDENQAIVTFDSSNDFQYIYTYPDLKLGKKIKLLEKCYGLQIVSDGIYTVTKKLDTMKSGD